MTKTAESPSTNNQASHEATTVSEIRKHFPALNRVHAGELAAYFDSPGGTQVPREVVEAMSDYLFNHNANTHWGYPTSNETDAIVAAARQTFADFLNAATDEIVFGQNMTSLTLHLSRALGRSVFRSGDEIIVTELDHHANVDCWRALEKERGVKLRVVPMNVESGQLEFDELANLLSEKTKLVAIGAASNALGTINDIERAAQMAREADALSFIDAVHYAPHNLVDVKKINCDFLACSAYKFYGPHIGILYARNELLRELDFPKLKPAPDSAPERAETGTQSFESIAGAAAAVDFLASLTAGNSRRDRLENTFEELQRRDKELIKVLWEGLSQIEGVKLYGPKHDAERTALVSFTVKDFPSEKISRELAKKAIFASHGNFYAATVVERLGVAEQGLVRIGCACYTTLAEIERLISAVSEITEN
jgi:cysteine desulfurase family protein (TIGR01976 family)